MTDDLVVWLRGRLDERERLARQATPGPWWYNPGKQWLDPEAFERYDLRKGEEFVGYGESPFSGCIAATGPANHRQSMADAEFIAAGDPKRALAEVAAVRKVLDLHGAGPHECVAWDDAVSETYTCYEVECPTVLALAQPYAGEPGWREEWSA